MLMGCRKLGVRGPQRSRLAIGLVGLVLLAFATGWGWPGLMTFTVVNANIGTPAASSAITQAGVFLGAGVGPLVLGGLIDNVSRTASWTTVAACLASLLLSPSGVARITRPR